MKNLDLISPFGPLSWKKCLRVFEKKTANFFQSPVRFFIKIELAFWQDIVVKAVAQPRILMGVEIYICNYSYR